MDGSGGMKGRCFSAGHRIGDSGCRLCGSWSGGGQAGHDEVCVLATGATRACLVCVISLDLSYRLSSSYLMHTSARTFESPSVLISASHSVNPTAAVAVL